MFVIISLLLFSSRESKAQIANGPPGSRSKKVLLIFSEMRDLPGNAMMEQAVRAEMLAHSTNAIEFYSESMDASRFPTDTDYLEFRDFIKNKYSDQNLDLMILFTPRNFDLARELPVALATNLPSVFVVVNDRDAPELPAAHPFTGIIQRFDIQGTIKFIFHLQPETRRVVVIGGISSSDQTTLGEIAKVARSVDGVDFEFWTNRPIAESCNDVKSLSAGTVVMLGSVQRDVTGKSFYNSQLVKLLAASAGAPVYVLGAGSIGSGAVGGNVIDLESLGTDAGQLAVRILSGMPAGRIPIEVRTKGVPMADWRALQRWHIKTSRLPADCLILFRPHSLWEDHQTPILITGAAFLAQAITIAALLVLRQRQRRSEAEILRQRTELTHVARVSMLGQLASALTHELNQPLGAILRNAEAAEIFLQRAQPNLEEIREILTDIRRDDKRAANVISRMRSLFKRQSLVSGRLDMRDLMEDTVAMARTDAEARRIKLNVEIPPQLPPAQGDRVHVQQVLLNLIFNGMDAMSASPKGRRLLGVRIAATEQGNLKVSVSDSGTGIAPDDAVRLFEPFFTTKSNGMGMGLAISKTIIEAHGGEIWVESSAVEGTTFTFLLPPAGRSKVVDGDLPAVH